MEVKSPTLARSEVDAAEVNRHFDLSIRPHQQTMLRPSRRLLQVAEDAAAAASAPKARKRYQPGEVDLVAP